MRIVPSNTVITPTIGVANLVSSTNYSVITVSIRITDSLSTDSEALILVGPTAGSLVEVGKVEFVINSVASPFTVVVSGTLTAVVPTGYWWKVDTSTSSGASFLVLKATETKF